VPGARIVKCVVWDIDNTLLNGVYLESGDTLPAADPVTAAALAEFAARGILNAIASKNPPEAAAHVARVTGREFAAVECGWGRKSDAVARIAADLGIGTDSLAFVDDDPYERAEVGAALPEVLVLAPEEVTDAATWPEFGVTAATGEARRRGDMYAARRRRRDAQRAFAGSPEDFLRSAGTQVTIAAASVADAPRLHELAARTRQFNSAGQALTEAEFAALIAQESPSADSGGSRPRVDGQGSGDGVMGAFRPSGGSGGSPPRVDTSTVRLRDAFGDDGIVGTSVTSRGADGTWTVRLLAMSCRAMGRGVIGALLTWLLREAAREGAHQVAVPCVLNDRNVPLRLALTGAGFRADGEPQAGPGLVAGPREPGLAAPGAGTVFRRDVGGSLPALPSWVTAPGEPGGPGEGSGPGEPGEQAAAAATAAAVAAEIRDILASATGRPELASLPADVPLFGDAVALDSLTGTLLLREVRRRFGVDVAAEDLNLDALATLSTLASFVARRRD
jgi:methoxymalonate biosynthesis protein